MNQEIKTCQNCKQNFTIDPEDFVFYDKIKVPPPTWCPECRMVRRMNWRNERTLYKRKCDAPGHNEDIISIYHKDSPLKVYDQKYWWSDEWDAAQYGRDYDFSKSFFEQFKNFRDNFPLMSVSNSNAINSDYCNVADQSKDCYLISAAFKNEKVLYSNRTFNNTDSLDLYVSYNSTLCYENVGSQKNYRLFFSRNCNDCSDSYFLYDCKNCSNCFGCANLRNKKYCIFNKQYTKEEYLEKIKNFDLGNFKSISEKKQDFEEIYFNVIHKYAHIIKSVNCSGDNINNAKNLYHCFDITDGAEDCRYLVWGGVQLKDSHSGGPGIGGGELLYEVFDTGIQGSRNFFTSVVYGSRNIQYSFNCHNSSNLFGCVGLRNKQYCILNKQYTKEEYEKLVPQIIEHMNSMPYIDKKGRIYKYGEFFPPELSPFSYNETIAQEYFPLSAEAAAKAGFNWKDQEERNITIDLKSEDLPDHIKDVDDSIINKVIQCANNSDASTTIVGGRSPDQNASGCTTAFKIIKPELDFYKKMNLPLPRLCPNCRHYQRLKQRNPLKLWKRTCQCAGEKSSNGVYTNTIEHFHKNQPCPSEFETTYSPDRQEIVYCEKCYQTEVV